MDMISGLRYAAAQKKAEEEAAAEAAALLAVTDHADELPAEDVPAEPEA